VGPDPDPATVAPVSAAGTTFDPVTVEAAGVALRARVRGEGPATVLVHGMAGPDWPLDALDGRVVTYDRRGHGASGAPQPYTRTTVSEQAEDLACVVRALDAVPALLVGADFGALVVLDVLLRHAPLARAAVLLDPPAYMFVAEATEALSGRRAALEDELRAGGPDALVSARGRVVDFGAIASLPLTHAGLAAIETPVAIVSSDGAAPHDVAAAEALLDALPAADGAADLLAAVRGAGG
jgi:pimeloyl-ACP methyl ester carboxylesterase